MIFFPYEAIKFTVALLWPSWSLLISNRFSTIMDPTNLQPPLVLHQMRRHLTAQKWQAIKPLKTPHGSPWLSYFCTMLANGWSSGGLSKPKAGCHYLKSHWVLAWTGQKNQPFFVYLDSPCSASTLTANGYLEHQNVIKIVPPLLNRDKDFPSNAHEYCVSHICNCM